MIGRISIACALTQKGAYELVCSPTACLDRGSLPVELREMAFETEIVLGAPFVNVR